MKSNPRAVFPVALIVLGILAAFTGKPGLSGSQNKAREISGKARFYFEQDTFYFGTVKEGEKIKREFKFKNVGTADLAIEKVTSSCGCTAVWASTGPYRHGESGQIHVTYDSRAKFGYTQKLVKVFSNDPLSPTILTLEGIVTMNDHPSSTTSDVLFGGSCAQCHSLPAKNKSGRELYDAVCAICHDFPPGSPKDPIADSRDSLSHLSKRRLKKIISKGVPGTSMPGFSHSSQGPLTKKQIDSIIQYLKSIKNP